jgi:hypothetical protein
MTQEYTPETTHDLPPAPPGPMSFRMEGDKAALYTALAEAQAEFQPIVKNKTAKVRTKAGDDYTFDYASLESVLDATRPALNRHGLSLSQPFYSEGSGYVLRTVLGHSSGAEMIVELFIAQPEGWQKLGSSLTYLKRYQVQCLLGVNSEDDDDGNQADGNQAKVEPRQQKPKPTPTPQVKAKPPATPPPPPVRANGSAPQPEPKPASEVKPEAAADEKYEGPPATMATLGSLKGTMVELKFSKDAAFAFCKEFGGNENPKKLSEPVVQELVKRCEAEGAKWLQGWQP